MAQIFWIKTYKVNLYKEHPTSLHCAQLYFHMETNNSAAATPFVATLPFTPSARLILKLEMKQNRLNTKHTTSFSITHFFSALCFATLFASTPTHALTAQSISAFAPATPLAFSTGLSFDVTATGGASANPLSFSSTTSTVCTVAGNKVSVLKVGTCTVAANQAGDTIYSAAPQVKANVIIAKGNQSISFAALENKLFRAASVTLAASATSSLAVSFTSSTSSVCTISATTLKIVGAGVCSINANQAGNTNFNAAPSVTQAFTVDKASQTINFAALASKPLSSTAFTISASASSALAVSFTSNSLEVCSVTGNSVKMLSTGMCSLSAKQAGNANFLPAGEVTQTFSVAKASQSISFAALLERALGGAAFDVVASSSAGLPVTFSTSTSAVCSVTGVSVNVLAVGTCTIAANQAGNSNYNAAPQVLRSFTVSKGLVAGAAPLAVSQNAAQQLTYIFNGASGQALSIAVSAVSIAPAVLNLAITAPDGSTLSSFQTVGTDSGVALPLLPATGVYKVVIKAGSSAAKFNLQLLLDAAGSLVANAPALNMTSLTPGHAGFYDFTGEIGQTFVLVVKQNSIPGNTLVTVYFPDGSEWQSSAVYQNEALALKLANLSMPGKYRIRMLPDGSGVGNLTIGLTAPQFGNFPSDGTPVAMSLAFGQQALYSFDGKAGDALALSLTALQTLPANGRPSLNVTDPRGRLLGSLTSYAAQSGLALPYLSVDGKYLVTLDAGAQAANFQWQLTPDVQAQLLVNGSAQTLHSLLPAQSASFRFQGQIGQDLSLLFADDSIAGFKTAYVYNPSGDMIASSAVNGGTVLAVPRLQNDGVYQVRLITDGRGLGNLSVSLIDGVSGNLQPNMDSFIQLRAGQRASFSFDGVAGQMFGLTLKGLGTYPANGSANVSVIEPNAVASTNLVSFIAQSGSNSGMALPKLPSSGRYTVLVDAGNNAASFSLRLLPDRQSSISTSGQPQYLMSDNFGQSASYTFNATSGQNLGLLLFNNELPGRSSATIYRPNGTIWKVPSVLKNEVVSLNLTNFPDSGIYTLRLTPDGSGIGGLSVSLSEPVSGMVLANTAATPLDLPAGTQAQMSFDAIAGQGMSLYLSNLSTQPVNGTLALSIVDANGGFVSSFSSNQRDSGLALPLFAESGRYRLQFNPAASSASFSLQLATDSLSPLLINGPAATMLSNRPAMPASYQINAFAGQHLSLLVSNDSIKGSSLIHLYIPDGRLWHSASVNQDQAAQLDFPQLPSDGKYLLRVLPDGSGLGNMTLAVVKSPGNLIANANALPLQIEANITTRLSFAGNAGQAYALSVTDLQIMPSHQALNLQVRAPDGSLLTTLALSSASNLPNIGKALALLPHSGNYSVVIEGANAVASFNLQLVSDALGSLQSDGSIQEFTSSPIGKAGSFNFNAEQDSILLLSNNTLAGNTQLLMYAPNGNLVESATLAANQDSSISAPKLAQGGSYLLRILPAGSSTGSMRMELQPVLQGNLIADAPPQNINLRGGRTQTLQFEGLAKAGLSINLQDFSSTQNDAVITVTLLGTDGHALASKNLDNNTPSFTLPLLPSTGSYRIQMATSANAIYAKLQLLSDASANLLADSTPVTLLADRAGKAGSYSFFANAGLQLSVRSNSLAGETQLQFYQADGRLWQTLPLAGNSTASFGLKDFPSDGNYLLRIVPSASSTGSLSFSLAVKKPPSVSLSVSKLVADLPASTLANFSLSAQAYADEGVAKVEFFKDSTLLASLTQAPFSYAWKDVAPGSYQISAKLTDMAGTISPITAANRLNLQVEGKVLESFAINASPKAGGVPLSVHFSVQNLLEGAELIPVRSVRADYFGDGVWTDAIKPEQGGQLNASYTVAGTYKAKFEITDEQGQVFTVQQEIKAELVSHTHQSITATFDGMRQMLANNDVNGALQLISDSAIEKYQGIFNALGANLPAAANRLGELGQGKIYDQFAQYVVTRKGANGPVSFLIYFVRGEDGLWRIDAM